ncbi:MAG: ribbon-helix-helix protein, CopG family [Halodesulfurarchaeum sp.]
MEKISVTLESDQVRELSDRVGAGEYDNRSEAVRELLSKGLEYDEVVRERDELEEQLRARNRREKEVTDLATYVQEEREWRSAPIWQRAKWWVFGKEND